MSHHNNICKICYDDNRYCDCDELQRDNKLPPRQLNKSYNGRTNLDDERCEGTIRGDKKGNSKKIHEK